MSKMNCPDHIIDRAVDIWCRAIQSPRFDNGDNSETGVLGMSMAATLAANAKKAMPDFEAATERFREALSSRLKHLRDHDGEKRPPEEIPEEDKAFYGADTYRFPSILGSDYGPDRDLAEAAKEAGIPLTVFPYKSDVFLYQDHIRTSFGYGARDVAHWPLPDGRWLVARLHGDDMDKVIAAVMDGRLPELTVEA